MSRRPRFRASAFCSGSENGRASGETPGYNPGTPSDPVPEDSPMSTAPQPNPSFKSAQHEFTDEHNRTISGLADAMRTVASLMQLLGLAFAIFFALQLVAAVQAGANYGPAVGLGAAAVLCLAIGFWTGGAAASFRRVVETKNEDVWHLMNALRKLQGMYSLLRTLVIGSLVLAVVGITLLVVGLVQK